MRLRLAELQKLDKKVQKVKVKSQDRYKEVYKVLHYQGLPFMLEII